MADLRRRDFTLERRSNHRHFLLRLASVELREVEPIRAAAGVDLPRAANTSVGTEPYVSWMAPGEWLISATSPADLLLDRLGRALAGKIGHVADATAGLATFCLTGDSARDLLARACSIDVHQKAFPTDACARTLFARIPVLLRARKDGFQIVCQASFSTYVEQWFERARHLIKAQHGHVGRL